MVWHWKSLGLTVCIHYQNSNIPKILFPLEETFSLFRIQLWCEKLLEMSNIKRKSAQMSEEKRCTKNLSYNRRKHLGWSGAVRGLKTSKMFQLKRFESTVRPNVEIVDCWMLQSKHANFWPRIGIYFDFRHCYAILTCFWNLVWFLVLVELEKYKTGNGNEFWKLFDQNKISRLYFEFRIAALWLVNDRCPRNQNKNRISKSDEKFVKLWKSFITNG